MERAKSLHEEVGRGPIPRIWWQKLHLFFQCYVVRIVGMILTFYIADMLRWQGKEESQTTIMTWADV